MCQVIRGRFGEVHVIPENQIVVGDILLLNAGDCVAADCILLDGQNLLLKQQNYCYDDTVSDNVRKSITGDGTYNVIDVVIYKDSLVMKGYGKALVCAVGDFEKLIKPKLKKTKKNKQE